MRHACTVFQDGLERGELRLMGFMASGKHGLLQPLLALFSCISKPRPVISQCNLRGDTSRTILKCHPGCSLNRPSWSHCSRKMEPHSASRCQSSDPPGHLRQSRRAIPRKCLELQVMSVSSLAWGGPVYPYLTLGCCGVYGKDRLII